MKVRIDASKCRGIGMCEMTAPAVFELGEDGLSHTINAEQPETERAAIEEAVAKCPTSALSIEE